MIVKVHRTQEGQILLAICDDELIGKKFEEGNLQLDISSSFYKGEEKSVDELKELVKDAYMLNIVGEKSIKFALENDLIEESHIIKIDNVPHAEAVIVREG